MKRLSLSALLLAAAGAVDAAECEYRKALDFNAEATGMRALEIAAGAGRLVVRGVAGSDRIEVKANACASSERLLEEMTLRRHRGDQRLVIETGIPDQGWSWKGSQYAYIDLELSVPARFELDVEDGSGEVEIERVARVSIKDSSGDVTLVDIGGDVDIDDGSGGIRVRTVAGSIRIEDGSGGIDVSGIEGKVVVAEDGSGEIDIRDVVGDLQIEEDGSGAIRIVNVGGSVLIDRDGSGGIDVKGVSGDLEVGRDGGGQISYRDVGGRVSVPKDRDRLK